MTQNPHDQEDPLFHEEPQSMLGKILPPLVLICAFGGFVALAIYAYKAGSQSVNEGELMVVEADKTPLKEKPEDPGGMQFPNQDKTIFETFSNNQPAKVERVLPTPEEPIKEPDAAGTASWVNDKLASSAGTPATPAAPAGVEQVFGNEDAAPVKEPEAPAQPPQVMNVQEELGKQAVGADVAATPAAAPEPVTAAPVDLMPKSSVEEKPVVKAEAPVKKEAPKAKPSAGKSLVQLGAYKSEADAKADFAKIQKKYAVLAGKTPVINRADLGEKGVFFRLRVSTDDAKALCSKLSASGQACMVVK